MFLTEFFTTPEGDSYADNQTKTSATKSKRKSASTGQISALAEGHKNSNGLRKKVKESAVGHLGQISITEDASMSDIITAKDYIAHAISNPNRKYEYFEFLKSLRSRHGAEYSTHVHQQAAKLAKGMN